MVPSESTVVYCFILNRTSENLHPSHNWPSCSQKKKTLGFWCDSHGESKLNLPTQTSGRSLVVNLQKPQVLKVTENLSQDSHHPFKSRDAVIALPLRPKERKWVLTKDPNLNQRQPLKPLKKWYRHRNKK